MAEQHTLRPVGLHTSENELSSVPEGSLAKAQNCVFLAPGVIGPRQGQRVYLNTTTGEVKNLYAYDNEVVAHTSDGNIESGWGNTSNIFTSPTNYRLKGQVAKGNLYLAANDGSWRITDVGTLARIPSARAGVQTPPGVLEATPAAQAGAWFGALKQVAYRLVLGMKDANGNLHLSAPGSRLLVRNEAGTDCNVTVTWRFPSQIGMTEEWFWQLYRTKVPAADSTDPGDEMFLVSERYFTTAEIAAESLSYIDNSPDTFLLTPLYTNQYSGDTILGGNERPPWARDIAWWRERMWYGSTRQPQIVTLQLLGVGANLGTKGGGTTDGTTGLRLWDQITLSDSSGALYTLTASTAENATTGAFLFAQSSSTPWASSFIEGVCASFCRVLSLYTNNGFNARYISGPDDPPGKIAIQLTEVNTAEFYVSVNTKVQSLAIGAMSRTATTVTVTLSNHGFETGDTVRVEPLSTPDANFAAGAYVVTKTGANTFTYSEAGAATTNGTAYVCRRHLPVPQWAWNPPPPLATFDITALVRATNVVTATCDRAHGLTVGQTIPIELVAGEPLDVNFPVGVKTIASVPSTTSFTYSETGSDATAASDYQSGQRVTSDNEDKPERLYWSKVGEPEAVPWVNFTDVGIPGKAILRVTPLKDNLFVWKEEGIYIISGDPPASTANEDDRGSLAIDMHDDTSFLFAPDSVAQVSHRLYALTNQGVIACSDAGVEIVSRAIEQDLFQYFGPTLNDLRLTYGVGAETKRMYMLGVPALSGATTAPYTTRRVYAFHTHAQAWTTLELQRTCGIVNPYNDTLYMGYDTIGSIYVENNNKIASDYGDNEIELTASAWNASTMQLTVNTVTGLSVGDIVSWGAGGIAAIITAIDSGTPKKLTLTGGTWTGATTVYAYNAIPCVMEFTTFATPSPADSKQYREIHAHHRQRTFYSGTWTFTTDLDTTGTAITVTPSGATYTLNPSALTYPGMPIPPTQLRIGAPQNAGRAAYLRVKWSITEGWALWTLNGLTLVYERVSERNQR